MLEKQKNSFFLVGAMIKLDRKKNKSLIGFFSRIQFRID
jgi:hypothetical protein